MAKTTITRIYTSYDQAASIVTQLEKAGIRSHDITLLSNSKEHATLAPYTALTEPNFSVKDQINREETFDAAVTTGGLVGGVGLLASLGLIALPGLGIVAGAGWLAATLAGFAFGAVSGASVSAISESLNKHGIDHETSQRYATAIGAGSSLVAVRCDSSELGKVESIMGTSDDVLGSTPNTTSRVA